MITRASFILIVILTAVSAVLGQHNMESEAGDNWLLPYGFRESSILHYRFDRYTNEDIAKFKEKMEALKNAEIKDEWEGNYAPGGDEMVSFSQLHWNSRAGFLDFYIYTCHPELRAINYGRVINSPDLIEFIPEFTINSPRKNVPERYIKVKWDNWQFLVAEDSLSAFAEKAAGINVDPQHENKWANFWARTDDTGKPLSGQPVFPGPYKKFARSPIAAKIISVGKRSIEKDRSFGNAHYTADTAFYLVTINAGKNKGVKKEMKFEVLEIEEEMEIIQVNAQTSVGIIARPIDDDKNDFCCENDKKNSCPEIKKTFSVRTHLGRFYY